MSDVTPKNMVKASYMEKRNQRFAAMSQTARRVKIEQNHTWRIRLLPVEMGPDKEPFVDIAQHWWAKSPITCPRHTAEAWGGNPDADCPVCAISERLRESSDEAISDMGYRARCNLRVRAWCIVFDQEDARGDVQDMTMAEILNPFEFEMYKTTWESFAKFQKWATSGRRGGGEGSEMGLLDLETGCDLLATQGAKGVTLDRCDPGPIFPLNDPKFDEYLKKIWSRIHKPQIIIPSEKDLWAVADKIEEKAQGGGGGGGGGRGGRGGRDDDSGRGRGRFGGGRSDRDQDYDRGGDRGGSRRSRFGEDQDADHAAPPARGASRRAPEPQGDADPEPQAPVDVPTRRRAPEPQAEQEQEAPAAPTRRRAPEPQQEAEPQQEQEAPQPPTRRSAPQSPARRAPEPQAEQEQEPADQEQPAPAPAAPPPTRRGAPTAPPPARKSQQPAAQNGDGDGDVAPQRPPQRRSAAPTQQQGVDEEEDNAPDEKRDPAPAQREPVDNDPPPPVGASGPAPKRSVGDTSDIKARLDKLNARGR